MATPDNIKRKCLRLQQCTWAALATLIIIIIVCFHVMGNAFLGIKKRLCESNFEMYPSVEKNGSYGSATSED